MRATSEQNNNLYELSKSSTTRYYVTCHIKRNKRYQGPRLLVYISFYVQLWFLTILLFVAKIHYMFRHNWPYSGVQIDIKMWTIPDNTHEHSQLGRNI
jgi:hypothetical protein